MPGQLCDGRYRLARPLCLFGPLYLLPSLLRRPGRAAHPGPRRGPLRSAACSPAPIPAFANGAWFRLLYCPAPGARGPFVQPFGPFALSSPARGEGKLCSPNRVYKSDRVDGLHGRLRLTHVCPDLLAPSPLAGEGWGEGEMVLVPGGPETPKIPPHPVPLPRWGEGINCGGWCKIVGRSPRWEVKCAESPTWACGAPGSEAGATAISSMLASANPSLCKRRMVSSPQLPGTGTPGSFCSALWPLRPVLSRQGRGEIVQPEQGLQIRPA